MGYDFSVADFEQKYGRARSQIIDEYIDSSAHFSEQYAKAYSSSCPEILASVREIRILP